MSSGFSAILTVNSLLGVSKNRPKDARTFVSAFEDRFAGCDGGGGGIGG